MICNLHSPAMAVCLSQPQNEVSTDPGWLWVTGRVDAGQEERASMTD